MDPGARRELWNTLLAMRAKTGLTVAMTQRVNLTAGLNHRYDSDPGTNLKKADTMFVTGVSMRFD